MKKPVKILLMAVVLLSLASMSLFNQGCSSSGGDESPSPTPTRFIFTTLNPFSEGSHPIISHLRNKGIAVLGETDSEYQGLLLNGSEITAEEIRTNAAIRKNMSNGKALLVINCTGAHKEALMKYTGVLFSSEDTAAYCIIPVAGTLNRAMAIIEHPVIKQPEASEMMESLAKTGLNVDFDEDEYYSNQEERRYQFENFAGPEMLAERVLIQLEENQAINKGQKRSESYPAELKYKTWRYTRDISWTIDNAWLKFNKSYLSWVMPAYAPMVGYQTFTLTPTINVSLYLDNDSANANGDFQWITVDYIGSSHPATSHSSYVKNNSIEMPINGSDYQVYDGNEQVQAWGYAQMAHMFNLYPSFTSPTPSSILHFYDAEPHNENNVTTYSSGYKFDVGVSMEGPDASISIDRSTETEIPDWSAENHTNNASLNFSWIWHSSNPSNTSNFTKLNTLNKSLFQPNASLVMQTNSLRTEAITFNTEYGISQISWCGKYKVGSTFDRWDLGKFTDFRGIKIDCSSVLYAIMESLSISPNQVQGGTSTTGTITIDKAAPAGGSTVTLTSSNSNWASVPATVTVPEGVASATFPITTYAVTGNSTVTIKGTLEGVTASANVTVTP